MEGADEETEWTMETLDYQSAFMRDIASCTVIKPKTEVLDKIRAEIEQIETYDGHYIDRAYVLQIIDKYKAQKGI